MDDIATLIDSSETVKGLRLHVCFEWRWWSRPNFSWNSLDTTLYKQGMDVEIILDPLHRMDHSILHDDGIPMPEESWMAIRDALPLSSGRGILKLSNSAGYRLF
jgi:hypothetical protein